jgi:hypothetical protein
VKNRKNAIFGGFYNVFVFRKTSRFVVSFLFLIFACKQNSPEVITAKSFALAPRDYENVEVSVSGKIVALGPGESFFIVEDETGKIMVSTEKISSQLRCEVGHQLKAVGSLKVLPESLGQYFSISRLESCR